MKNIIVWLRQDLRIRDNPALFAAADGRVIPVYIHDDQQRLGQASKWWLHHSLISLDRSLKHHLNVYRGEPTTILVDLAERWQADVFWNRCYDPFALAQSQEVEQQLRQRGISSQSFNGSLLWEPWDVLKSDKTPYRVFTPYYRAAEYSAGEPAKPCNLPNKMVTSKDDLNTTTIDSLGLLPSINWYSSLEQTWKIGEISAWDRLANFVCEGLRGYKLGRDFPGKLNGSRLSPHLHFGEIAPHAVWYAVKNARTKENGDDVDCLLKELAWREFCYYQLYHEPTLPLENHDEKFDAFAWRDDKRGLQAWQRGQTGIPLVDAGMRELWQTGFMHNRVRMVTASFLIKNLLIHWRDGESWFFDCLVDADVANNSANWQWVAGCGADAAPYFRIFNPTTQGEKFDSAGAYTRHYVPELKMLPDKYLFRPWDAPPEVLQKASVVLGKTYPHPLVDLAESRNRALATYMKIRRPAEN